MSTGSDPYQGAPSGSGWNQPAAGWPPAGQPGAPGQPVQEGPGGPSAYAGPPPTLPRRGRPGLIVLIAVLVEIVLVAAVENQALTRHILSFGNSHRDNFVGQSALASLTYSWRFTPPAGDSMHMWLGQTVGLVSIFVLTALLMLTVVRGPITFGRAWFGTWMVVIVATGLGSIIARAIFQGFVSPQGVDRVSTAVFFGTNGYTFAAGIGLGLVVGLIAGLVAVISRRKAEPLFAPPVAGPPPDGSIGSGFFEGEPRRGAAPREEPGAPSLRKDSAPQPTAGPQPTAVPQTTAELPAVGAGGGDRGDRSFDEGGRQTTQLPRLGVAGSSGSGNAGPDPARTASPPSGGSPAPDDQQTTSLPTGAGEPSGRPADQPAEPTDGRQTTQLPRFGDEQGNYPQGQAPRQFPRPPDDEDLGHIPE